MSTDGVAHLEAVSAAHTRVCTIYTAVHLVYLELHVVLLLLNYYVTDDERSCRDLIRAVV